jgi:hypothetical protein
MIEPGRQSDRWSATISFKRRDDLSGLDRGANRGTSRFGVSCGDTVWAIGGSQT